jgi:hypothetical protein
MLQNDCPGPCAALLVPICRCRRVYRDELRVSLGTVFTMQSSPSQEAGRSVYMVRTRRLVDSGTWTSCWTPRHFSARTAVDTTERAAAIYPRFSGHHFH